MARKNKREAPAGIVMPEFSREFAVDMQELRRSSAASPHRNRKRYSRADVRRDRQRGWD